MATIKEMRKELGELGVKYPSNATAPKLKKLLSEVNNVSEKAEDDEIKEDDEEVAEDEGEADGDDEEIVDEEEEDKPEAKKEDKDHLRQYQYKKVNDVPTIGGKLTDPAKGTKADIMKQALLKQDRIRILIQKKSGEGSSFPMSVNLNGYRLDLPKNEYLNLPVQIAKIIMDSQQQRDVALQYNRIDGDSKKETALL